MPEGADASEKRGIEQATKRVAIAGVATLVIAIVLLLYAPQKITASPPCPHVQPILCAEFPPSGSTLSAWLRDPANPPERWRNQLRWDLLFLVGYGSVYAFGALAIAKRKRAWPVVATAILGSGCDAVENIMLLNALDLSTISDLHAAAIRTTAQIKFLALGVSSLLGGWLSVKAKARFARTQAAGGVLALCGVTGVWVPVLWQLAGLGIFICLVVIWSRSLISLWSTRAG